MSDHVTKLGNYELLASIAKGGMGEIFLARVRRAGGFEKRCIVKRILPTLADDPEFVNQFLDEARIAATLVHGNIVPIFDFGSENNDYYFAMEYIAGRDLRTVLREVRHQGIEFPIDLASFIVAEVCKGLDYAHKKVDHKGNSLGIVHRDISPSNILISSTGEVKIIDFGIARAANRLSETISGRIQGKFCYMSPEQASGSSTLDSRSDLFSLGVVYDEILTGRRIFLGNGDNPLESLDLVKNCAVSSPANYINDLRAEKGEEPLPTEVAIQIDDIVFKFLEKDPERRFQSAHETLVHLSNLLSFYRGPFPVKLVEFLETLFPDGIEVSYWDDFEENSEIHNAEPLSHSSTSASHSATSHSSSSFDKAMNHELDLLLLGEKNPFEDEPNGAIATLSTTPAPSSRKAQDISKKSNKNKTLETATVNHSRISPANEKSTPSHPAHLSQPSVRTDQSSFEATIEPIISQYSWRTRIIFSVVILILFSVISVAVYAWFQNGKTGSIYVESSPDDAIIFLDNNLILDARTPSAIDAPAGAHNIELRKEGFQPFRARVEVPARGTISISPTEAILIPYQSSEPRKIFLDLKPKNANVTVDNVKVTAGFFMIKPGNKVFLRATAKGCDTYQDQVGYEHPSSTVTVRLNCKNRDDSHENSPLPSPPTDSTLETENHSADKNDLINEKVTRKKSTHINDDVTIRSTPPATILLNGKKIGITPYKFKKLKKSETVTLTLPGYLEKEVTLTPNQTGTLDFKLDEAPDGCIKARAVWPNVADILIDGKLVSQGKSFFLGSLSSGAHKVTFSNDAAHKKETFNVNIKSGSECAIVAWDIREKSTP